MNTFRVSRMSISMFWIFQSHLLRIPNISCLRPTGCGIFSSLSGKLSPYNRFERHSHFAPLSLRGGNNEVAQTEKNHSSSSDNYTTNAEEQADAARLKSAMNTQHNASASVEGVLDTLPSVSISPSGIFKYVLIEATDKQVCVWIPL
jgi:hypothetical protein